MPWYTAREGAKFLPQALFLICVRARTAKNSGQQREFSLFLQRLNPRQPRISAKNEISLADNFLQKQQKQRGGWW
jgi:hypothetical protein